jgi:hypothetical protein
VLYCSIALLLSSFFPSNFTLSSFLRHGTHTPIHSYSSFSLFFLATWNTHKYVHTHTHTHSLPLSLLISLCVFVCIGIYPQHTALAPFSGVPYSMPLSPPILRHCALLGSHRIQPPRPLIGAAQRGGKAVPAHTPPQRLRMTPPRLLRSFRVPPPLAICADSRRSTTNSRPGCKLHTRSSPSRRNSPCSASCRQLTASLWPKETRATRPRTRMKLPGWLGYVECFGLPGVHAYMMMVMCVCVCVCEHPCMYIHVCRNVRVYVYVCTYACERFECIVRCVYVIM